MASRSFEGEPRCPLHSICRLILPAIAGASRSIFIITQRDPGDWTTRAKLEPTDPTIRSTFLGNVGQERSWVSARGKCAGVAYAQREARGSIRVFENESQPQDYPQDYRVHSRRGDSLSMRK